MDTVGIISYSTTLLPIPTDLLQGDLQWVSHILWVSDQDAQTMLVNRHYFEKWWEELQESSELNGLDIIVNYLDVPFLAFALFRTPWAGMGPPYFLPRIFLPRNLTRLPPIW